MCGQIGSGALRMVSRIVSSSTQSALTALATSGKRCRRRSTLLGLPTSIALANVVRLGFGSYTPLVT